MSELVSLFSTDSDTEQTPTTVAPSGEDIPTAEQSTQNAAAFDRSAPTTGSVRPLSKSERGVLEDALEDASEMLADDICAALLCADATAREEAQKLLPLLAWGGAAVTRVEATVFEAMADAGRPKAERLRLAAAWKTALFDAARRPGLHALLQSSHAIDRQVGLVALSAPGCPDGAEIARRGLDDADQAVQATAFAALIDSALPTDVDALVTFATRLNADVLEPHLGSLIDLCTTGEGCALLAALAQDPCAHKRRLALMGHLMRPLACAAELALEGLTDADDRCRMLALSLLERDGGRPHLEAVLPLLGDASPRVSAMARDVAQVLRRVAVPLAG